MKFIKFQHLIWPAFSIAFISCSGELKEETKQQQVNIEELTKSQPEVHGTMVKEEEIMFSNPLNAEWVTTGKSIYEIKCQSCHKLTNERLVGPGWSGVTKKRTPAWLTNMITNVDMMLESDTEAQKLLELCLVRMPNQNLTREESREVIEFMRKNDGEK